MLFLFKFLKRAHFKDRELYEEYQSKYLDTALYWRSPIYFDGWEIS